MSIKTQSGGNDITTVVVNGIESEVSEVYANGVLVYRVRLGIFYGSGVITRISNSGNMIGLENSISLVDDRNGLAGGRANDRAVFYGGTTGGISGVSNRATSISHSGDILNTASSIGTARRDLAGTCGDSNALFYGGNTTWNSYSGAEKNTTTRINNLLSTVGSETSVGTKRKLLAGAKMSNLQQGLFYGGWVQGDEVGGTFVRTPYNLVSKIKNSDGAIVGSETSVGSKRVGHTGATGMANCIFYGNNSLVTNNATINTITIINNSGSIVGSEKSITSHLRRFMGGATVLYHAQFYAGYTYGANNTIPIVTQITDSGAVVGTEKTIGTGRTSLAGAGL